MAGALVGTEKQFLAQGHETRAAARQASLCAACPKLCRHTCPVAEATGREAYTPWALMSALHLESQGAHPAPVELSQDVYACSACRACQGFCHFHQDVPGVLHARRAKAFARDEAPESARALASRFHAWGNLYQQGLHESVFSGLDPARLRPSAREIVWIDSATLSARPQIVHELLTLLNVLDLKEIGIWTGPYCCCGDPLYHAGDLDGFRLYASGVAKALSGFRRVYCTSPDCAETLRGVYPAVGIRVGPEVTALVALLDAHQSGLAAALDARRATRKEGSSPSARSLLQVPCSLERGLGLGGAVRTLATLLLGYVPREAPGDATVPFCTGAGGALPELLPELAEQVGQRCLSRLGPAANERVLTACPKAARHLETLLPGRVDGMLEALLRAIQPA